jgi:hypothetical protein
MRERILALLRGYPSGLTAMEIKVYLGVDRSLSDVLPGMVRQQRLERKGSGPTVRYVTLGG